MNNNQNPLPVIPFKPQIENNQEELIAKAEDIIAPKKSKTKIILTTLVAFLLLGSVAGAVFLVRQNQDIREQAIDGICSHPETPGGCGDPDCCRDWEVYENGCCHSTAGCTQDSDCTAGKTCVGGVCEGSQWNPQCGGTQNQCPCGNENNTAYDQCLGGKLFKCGNDCCMHDSGTACGTSLTCANWGKTCDPGFHCDDSSGTPTCVTDTTTGQPRNATAVCTEQGSVTSTCIADPKCTQNGGVCCTIASKNYCCYGDSQTRRDGACYLGGQQTAVSCSGSTITNNTTSSISLNRFTGTGSCPFSSPAGTKQLGAGQSANASCEQLDAAGLCGVCDDTNCGGTPTTPPTNPTPTPIPTTTISCQCDQIKAYDTAWKLLTSADLAALKPGDKVRFVVTGTTTGTIDKMRYKVNSGAYVEPVTKKPTTNENYYEYTIPANVTSFSISAQVHLKETNQWF